MNLKALVVWISVAVLAACSSTAPIRYHTLLPPAAADSTGATSPPRVFVRVHDVSVPAQDQRAPLVVREDGDRLVLLESDRWAAPLADEIKGALQENLTTRLAELPETVGPHRYWLSVEVLRIEARLGGYTMLEANWTMRSEPASSSEAGVKRCTFRFSRPLGGNPEDIVPGYQRAVAALSEDIVGAIARHDTDSKCMSFLPAS